jgi:hypothetical protein
MKIEFVPFVPYEQALALKELGFNEPCFGNYNNLTGTTRFFFGKTNEGCIVWNKVPGTNDIVTSNETILAPTFSQAFRFFREKHKLYGSYGQTNDNREEVNGFVIGNFINGMRNRLFADWEVGTYEEAELACLDKLIEIVKTN